ncbi:MAG: hypothetical protein ABI587_10270 [Gemmatimonadales bacterium]
MRSSLLLVVAALAACAPKKDAAPASADTTAAAPDTATKKVSATEGFSTPESVLWDAAQGVWFVSNINGNPSARDGNGFISRLKADGTIDSLHFIVGGANGVTLNGPKGLAISGDTLWVADIDAVRGFNRLTGAPVASVAVGKKAHFLNDLVAGPDGALYVTDTGILFDAKGTASHPGPDRIYAIRGRAVSVAAEGDWLQRPNGIAWDNGAQRYFLVPFGGSTLRTWAPGAASGDSIATGPGSQDGVEFLDGIPLITSWADSTVFALSGGVRHVVVSGVNSPADIGLDPARRLLAIPLFMENRVEFWRVGPLR